MSTRLTNLFIYLFILTQRISSGLYSVLHLRESLSILEAFLTFQFLAVKYRQIVVSEQYTDNFSGSVPINFLISLICN